MLYSTGVELVHAMHKKAMLESATRRKEEAARLLDYFHNAQMEYVLEDIRARYPKPEKRPCVFQCPEKDYPRLGYGLHQRRGADS